MSKITNTAAGIFGRDAVEAAAITRCRSECYGGDALRASIGWQGASEEWRDMWRRKARFDLNAAVAALDREVLVDMAADALREAAANPNVSWPNGQAHAVVAGLFPRPATCGHCGGSGSLEPGWCPVCNPTRFKDAWCRADQTRRIVEWLRGCSRNAPNPAIWLDMADCIQREAVDGSHREFGGRPAARKLIQKLIPGIDPES